ncbi:hypothetical protein [Deinococcus peraridilitoris]|uniref:Uncharacterized protein n=1 Tax=Deinococcus peraridilitoris (strain DSM 19664 / LMG 22246 / CIP 109416 / KR-200) TaxID=937777 RepID=L0A325_DEIPD|nr:hypothetical protein [Deinococcus peraridilitoris]AFZ67410.1 hypothetical protein Deipe_1902 [Deinococcus peraridilitoris DSM 19664]
MRDRYWIYKLDKEERALWRRILTERTAALRPKVRPTGMSNTDWQQKLLQASEQVTREAVLAFQAQRPARFTLDELLAEPHEAKDQPPEGEA